ncbi:hypothetical protein J5226_20230 [Lysobacter sp. K5869]|uniref:hypothetical protein n=1 Tax=Lysobacter sp. K5869 TaxID=2820808 RepID=UPI001C063979|nr:hypothetical protein [Lysobacter sp. K5869]QWP75909.1 hypothetical protein J5226_20230 [Lysobacter sp. K5869]
MSQLRHEIRPLIEELAQKKGLPPTAVADIESTIASSPYLSNIMVAAIQSGSLKHLDTTDKPNQSGHYEQRTGTIHLNTSNFDAKSFDSASARRDNLAVVIGHEAGHALLADASERERYALRYNMGEAIRAASNDESSADLTGPANRYVDFMRRNEAMAELVGMNALASRTAGADGAFDKDEFLRRAEPSTPCVDQGILAPGIDLSPAGIQIIGNQFRTSPAIEAVAQCYTDPGASIGQHGDSSYRDTHGTYVMKMAASELNDYAKGTTMHVPAIELNMATLKLDPNRIERAGLDLGGAGRSFSYVDTSNGRREYESVSHTLSAAETVHRLGGQALAQSPSAPALRADAPGHPDYQAFEMFHRAAQADGRWSQAEARNLAAAGLAAVKADPVVGQNLSGVVIGRSADGAPNLIGYASPHGPAGPHHHLAIEANAAAQVPADKSLDRVEQLNQQQTQRQAQTQPLEQQAAQPHAAPKIGLSH